MNVNVAKEYYLTDFVELAVRDNYIIQCYELPKEEQYQIVNINTIDDLVVANKGTVGSSAPHPLKS